MKEVRHALEIGDVPNIRTYQAAALQVTVHRTLQKHCDLLLKPYGITKMQWLIIGTIWDAGEKGARLTDVARELGTTMPYMTAVANKLEAKGIVARSKYEGDQRAKSVIINPDFLPTCEAIERVLRHELQKSIYAHVEPRAFQVYLRVLYKLSLIKPT